MTHGQTNEVAIYVLGRIEQFVRDYAESNGIPTNELTQRVAELLHSQANGQGMGPAHHLPAVRRKAGARSQAVEPVAVGKRSYLRKTPHWTQLPRNRKKMMRRILQMRRAKKNAPFMKGYDYQGKHWTQQPENKARLRAAIAKGRQRVA